MKKVIVSISLGIMWYVSSCYMQGGKVSEKNVNGQTNKQTPDVNVIGCDGATYRIVTIAITNTQRLLIKVTLAIY